MDVYCATVIEILSCKVPVHVATIIAEMAGVRHWERAMWLYNHIENLRRTPFTVYSFQTERKTLEWLLREMCVFQGELLSLLTSSESDPLSRKSLFATKRRPFSLTLVSSLPPTENESTDRSFSFPLNLPSKANIASEILIFTDLPGYFFISSLETHSEIPIKPTVVKNSQYSVYKIKKEEANFNEDLAIHVKNSRDRYGLYRRRALIALAADLESINQIRKIVMRRRLTELLTQVKVPIIREKRKRIVSSGLDSTLQLPAKVFDYVCGNFLGVGDEHNGVSEEYIIQLGTLLRSATPIVHVASWPSPWTNIFGDNSRLYFKAVQPPERFVEVEGLVTLFKTGIIKIEQWEEDTDKAFVDEIKEYQGTWLPQSVTETEIIVQANVALLYAESSSSFSSSPHFPAPPHSFSTKIVQCTISFTPGATEFMEPPEDYDHGYTLTTRDLDIFVDGIPFVKHLGKPTCRKLTIQTTSDINSRPHFPTAVPQLLEDILDPLWYIVPFWR